MPSVASGGGGGGDELFLVAMPTMRVPIIDGRQADGRLIFNIVLRAPDAEQAKALEAEMPALREAVLASAIEFARLYASPHLPVDADRLAHQLQAELHHREPAVSGLLLTRVMAESV